LLLAVWLLAVIAGYLLGGLVHLLLLLALIVLFIDVLEKRKFF